MRRLKLSALLTFSMLLTSCSDDKFSKLAAPVFLQQGSTTTTLPEPPNTTLQNPGSTTTTLGNPLTTTTTLPNPGSTTTTLGNPITTTTLGTPLTTTTLGNPLTTTTLGNPITTTTSGNPPLTSTTLATVTTRPGVSSTTTTIPSSITTYTVTTRPNYTTTTTTPVVSASYEINFNRVCRTIDRPYYEKFRTPELRIHLVKLGAIPTYNSAIGREMPDKLRQSLPLNVLDEDQLLFTQALPALNHSFGGEIYSIMPHGHSVSLPQNVRDLIAQDASKSIIVRVCESSAPKQADTLSTDCLSGQTVLYTPAQIAQGLILPIHHAQGRAGAQYCDSQMASPLVLDLDDDGIGLAGADPGVRFDLMASGNKVNSGWPNQNRDAFLALDLNRNGQIDSGAELFGNHTRLRDGSEAANGFEALKQYDLNRDAVIDSRDRIYFSLILWVDSNRDGISQKGEMKSLGQEAVQSIDLDYIHINERDGHGNETRQRSAFKKFGDLKRIRRIVDIWFVIN